MPISLPQSHNNHKSSEQSKATRFQTENIKNVLMSIQEQTSEMLDEDQIQYIERAIKQKEMMTFQVLYLTQPEYFQNQFQKIQSAKNKQQALDWVNITNDMFLLGHQASVGNKDSTILLKNAFTEMKDDKNRQINKRIKQKLVQASSNLINLKSTDMKSNRSMSLSHNNGISQGSSFVVRGNSNQKYMHQKTQQQLQKMMEFREPSYWQKNTDKTQQIKEFLSKHRQEDRQRRRKIKKQLQRAQKKKQLEDEKLIEKRQEEKKLLIKRGLEKSLEYKQKRTNYIEEHQNQLEQIEEFLQKISSQSKHENKRLHQILEEKYREQKNRENMKKREKLEKRKEQFRPLEAQDFEEHLQRYMEQKESLTEDRKTKKQDFQAQKHETQEQLKNMFHSKRYNKIAQSSPVSQNPYRSLMSDLKSKRSKQRQFAQSVGEKFKPIVSERKRHLLEQSVKQLLLEEDPTKKKVHKNGSVVFQDKVDIDGRKMGKEYLNYLRKYLEGKPKKKHRSISSSLSEMPEIHKKIDYLRENKPSNLKFKAQNSEWKKVMDDDSFKAKDKYIFVKESITTLEHRAIDKEIEARNLKRSSLELQKKEQFDKLYMQSIEAKMAILNGLMLGK